MALKMNQQKTMCSYVILFLVVWLGMASLIAALKCFIR